MAVPKESKDLVEKNFEAFPDVAADIINALLYDGHACVEARNLMAASTETIYEGAGCLRNQYQDLAKYELCAGEEPGRIRAIYQFANQTDVDYRMILRKAGYTGAVYREQYEGKVPNPCPVVEMVLYWGRKRWNASRSMRRQFRKLQLPAKIWQYTDDLKLHVWEMRRLPPKMRERFNSDMRIVLDYLAEGDDYCSDRPVIHKEALVKMIRTLAGETDVEDTAQLLQEMQIREEDEITVCELFDQYERRGRSVGIREGISQGIKVLISNCKDLKVSFEETAERVKRSFDLEDAEVQRNMGLYW